MDLQPIWLSIQVSTIATIISLPLAIGAAWVLARKQFPGKIVFETIIMAPLVMPPLVTGYLLLLALGKNTVIGGFLYNTFGMQISFTWIAAVIASAVVSFPLMVRALEIGFKSFDQNLEGMARTLGASRPDTFINVTLPLALPGIISAVIIGFARSLGEFGATIVFAGNIPGRTQTIPLAIYSAINRPDGEKTAFVFLIVSLLLSFAAMIATALISRSTKNIAKQD